MTFPYIGVTPIQKEIELLLLKHNIKSYKVVMILYALNTKEKLIEYLDFINNQIEITQEIAIKKAVEIINR